MKKIFVGLMILIIICGCSEKKEKDCFTVYNEIKQNLITETDFHNDYPFQVRLIYNEDNGEYRYDIIIDQPSSDMYDITAMSYADENEEDMCPNIGIFDENDYNLRDNFIDKSNGFYKGIQLSGTTQKKKNIKIYISYYTDKEKTKKVEQYIEVKE